MTLRDESQDGTLAAVIEQVDSGTSIADILAAVDSIEESEVRQILAELDSKNLLQRMDSRSRRDRSPLPLRFSTDDLKTLSSKSVLIVSSGRIGPRIVDSLSRAGVGDIRVRHRQNDGAAHEFVAADEVEVWEEKGQFITDMVESVDLVLTATQQPWYAAAECVNEHAVDAGTPYTHTELTGYDVVVGPTVLPGETACYECYRHRRNRNIGSPDNYLAFERAASGRNGVVGDYLPFTEIAAGFSVTDVLNLLCYGHGYTVGSVITFDMSKLSMESNDVLRFPRCEVCSSVADSIGRDSLFAPEDLVKR